MQNRYLKTKIEERAAKSSMLQTLQDAAVNEGRDLTEPERKTFEEITNRLTELDADIKRIKDFDEGASKFASMVGAQAEAEERAEHAAEKTQRQETTEERSVVDYGKKFVESNQFKNYVGAGTSGRLSLPGPASMEFRAAITLGDTFDGVFPPQQWAGPTGPTFRTPFLDAIGRVATSQNAVMYLRYLPNPPSDAQVVEEGALKPEADFDVQEVTSSLQTYAHYKAITRQALEDIAQIQTIIQNRLLAGVRTALEKAAVTALLGDTDIPTATGPDMLRAIRVGIATAEASGYSPNAIVVNPADAGALDLAAMGASFSGPVRSGNAWGLPIVSAASVPAGTAYIGDLSQGLTWFDRGTTDVYLSDSHADFFLRNTLLILAEARASMVVSDPGALVKVTAGEPEPDPGE